MFPPVHLPCMTTKFRFYFSISAHGSGKLSVECIGVGEIGTSFRANFHTLKQLHGKVKYEEGREIEVHLNSDQEITDMFNIR